MKIVILGRTECLLRTAKSLKASGHEIPLVCTAPSEQHYSATEKDFESFANTIGAGFFNTKNLKAPDCWNQLTSVGADIAISVNWPFILGDDVIRQFRLGVLNAHCGDLPRYRGNACPNWAILNGEESIGLCVHFMNAGEVDSGPVLVRRHLEMNREIYIQNVYDWTESCIPEMMCEAVDGLSNGTLTPTPQPDDPSLSLRCFPRKPEDGKIIWSDSAESIHRLIRATSHPLAGAFSFLDTGEKVVVWRAEPYELTGPIMAVPGQIMFRVENDPVVACGEGALRLTEVSMENRTDDEARKEVGRSLRRRFQTNGRE